MNRLLNVAELIAGESARHRVFDPMLADWQRELGHARERSASSYAFAFISGSLGFARALLFCGVSERVWFPPLRGTLASVLAMVAAVSVSIAVLLIQPLPASMYVPRDLSEPLVQRWVLVWSGTIVPPVFLLATFVLRRDARATFRHAIVMTIFAAAAMTAVVVNSTDEALRRRFDTFEFTEHMRDLRIANHRAGRRVYSGNRYRDDLRTTVEQRREQFEQYQVRMAAIRRDPPPTWVQRFEQWQPVLLSIIFAIMGWTLAGIGAATARRGMMWWALTFMATIAMTRMLTNLVGVPMPRPPQWIILPAFASMTAALLIVTFGRAVRNRNQQLGRNA